MTFAYDLPHGAIAWRKVILLNAGVLAEVWPLHFPKHDFGTGRLMRHLLDSFEQACDRAEAEAGKRQISPRPQIRPTPQVTVEAIWLSVRERGLAALNEPVNRQRLDECDSAAQADLRRRIEKLRASR
jgi:hypothetical protein